MIDTRLIGPKDDQYAVLSLGTVWLATTKKPYAEAVKAAIAATIAGGGATDAAPSATAATDLDEFVRVARTFSDEHYQNALVAELRRAYHALALQDAPVDHSYNRSASISEGRYVCTCGACSRPDWAQQLPGAEIFDRAARYEYIRTLNPRKFAALYNEALMGVYQFDDLVDCYRDAGEKP
jgi:hypothetical protein